MAESCGLNQTAVSRIWRLQKKAPPEGEGATTTTPAKPVGGLNGGSFRRHVRRLRRIMRSLSGSSSVKGRRGLPRQRSRRSAERLARMSAVAFLRCSARHFGLSSREAAERLGIASRTHASWQQRWREDRLELKARGRPALDVARSALRELKQRFDAMHDKAQHLNSSMAVSGTGPFSRKNPVGRTMLSPGFSMSAGDEIRDQRDCDWQVATPDGARVLGVVSSLGEPLAPKPK